MTSFYEPLAVRYGWPVPAYGARYERYPLEAYAWVCRTYRREHPGAGELVGLVTDRYRHELTHRRVAFHGVDVERLYATVVALFGPATGRST